MHMQPLSWLKSFLKAVLFLANMQKRSYMQFFFEKIPKNDLSKCGLRVAADFSGALKKEFNKINCQLQFITMRI